MTNPNQMDVAGESILVNILLIKL